MRCYSCNDELSDYEATRKSNVTEEYIDLCDFCFSTIEEFFTGFEESLELLELKNEQISETCAL